VIAILKQFAVAAGTAAVEAIVNLVRGKRRDSLPEVDVTVSEPPHPGFKDIEHQRAQERASIALSKAAEATSRAVLTGGASERAQAASAVALRKAGESIERGGIEDPERSVEEGAAINVDRAASTSRPPRRKSGRLPSE
jgi:hypothetical protein